MKKLSFVPGLIAGLILGVLVGGGAAIAASEVLATPTTSTVLVNGQNVNFTAHNIGGANYFKLRDIGKAVDFGVTWEGSTNTIYIDTTKGYVEETTTDPNQKHIADGCGQIAANPITEKNIDGNELSREDFSASANSAVFDSVYTRGAYNAIRQTIVDRDKIVAGNDSTGNNPYYCYANFVDSSFTLATDGKTRIAMDAVMYYLGTYGDVRYQLGYEPYIKSFNGFFGYNICKPYTHNTFAPANEAVKAFINEISTLTDREKIKHIADYISDKMIYGSNTDGGINVIFTSPAVTKGQCGAYSNAFSFLCSKVNIPCVAVSDDDHAWNTVYIEGKWFIVDVTNYDTGRSNTWLLTTTYPKQDDTPQRTNFVKELLVPGNTK